MTEHEPTSPRIFAPSSLVIDDSKLCFNKNHFSRPDFDVQRFMNLARRRAGLEQIQKDLRLYLKSVQHSMIELINDDYADFVHLSSNLVALQSSIDKIDKDLQSIWTEFENSTGDSVGTAEQIELRCDQLSYNRKRQTILRDKIAFLAALQRLQQHLSKVSSSILWLEKVASCVVDLTSYTNIDDLDKDSREYHIYTGAVSKLEQILCKEGVQSTSGDCSTLPLVLSVLSLTNSTHVLTAAIVSDFLHPKLVEKKENNHILLNCVLDGVIKVRDNWIKVLGIRFSGNLKAFLDQTFLTFILTFLEKCLGMVIVPTDTKIFHKCFLTIEEFIRNWPSPCQNRGLLKSIRDKFNFLVYFKLTTYKLSKQIDTLASSEKIELAENDERVKCAISAAVLTSIEAVWSDDVFLFPLIDKFWDFTLKMLSKHLSWAHHIMEVVRAAEEEEEATPKWKNVLHIRSDLKSLHSAVFDLCLEKIWTKLRDMDIETSLFGQSLTRLGQRVDVECVKYDKLFLEIAASSIEQEMDAAADMPKNYRWTRKPAPTAPSPYIVSTLAKIDSLEKELGELEMDSDEVIAKVTTKSFTYLLTKLNEVYQGTQMHSSSRLLVSRKTNIASSEGLSDNDKIKIQIFRDLEACSSFSTQRNIQVEGLSELLEKCRADSDQVRSSSSSPIPQRGSAASLVDQDELHGLESKDDIYRGSPQSTPPREG